MPRFASALLEQPILHSQWTLEGATGDEWCSLVATPAGWTLSIHGGEFTVVAEGGSRDQPEEQAVDALQARLRALGWSERPAVRVRPKPDRRHRPVVR